MKKLNQRQAGRPAGFTLIEMLVYMGIFSIFLLTLTDMFVSILDVKRESQDTSSVDQDGRYLLARLSYDVGRADDITAPVNFGESSSSVSLVISGEQYQYLLESGDIKLTNNSGSFILNSPKTTVPALSFKKIGNAGGKETLQVIFTLESVGERPSGHESMSFQTALGIR